MAGPTVTRVVKFIRKGEKGDDGRSVLTVDVEFAQNTSTTIAPTSGWQTDPPAWRQGYYIWQRICITYNEGGSEYTQPVCLTGSVGATGNGVVSITEEYYRSTSAYSLTGGSWSTTRPTWVNGYYFWTRTHIVLTDTDFYTAAICVTGGKGSNGVTYYTWIKFADSLESTGYPATMYDTPTANTRYIGIAANQTSSTPGTAPALYKWTQIRGNDGTSFTAKGTVGGHYDSYSALTSATGIVAGTYYLYDGDSGQQAGLGAYYVHGWGTATAADGDAYVTKADKHLWVKAGQYWMDLGEMQGPKGDKGDKGDQGAVLRGPQAWSDCANGYAFQAGGGSEAWKDVVLYGDDYYSCVKSHTKTANNYPGSTEDVNNHYWQLGDKIELVATKILLASYALVKNLGVEAIDMKDAAGNVLFQAKDGVVTCKTGNFTNVNITSGKVAGFAISGNGLTNDPFTNDAYVIFRNDTHKAFAGIGGNVLPASTGARAVARFENEDLNDWWGLGANYAMILSAKGAARNYAFHGTGNGLLDGWIDGFTFFKVSLTTNNTVYDGSLDMKKANRFFVKSTASGAAVALPKLSAVKTALGIGDRSFAVKIVVSADLGSNNFDIYGRNNKKSSSGTYPWNTNELPLMTHWDGSNWDTVGMGKGDSIVFLLVYDTTRTDTINNYNTKYTARIINRQD